MQVKASMQEGAVAQEKVSKLEESSVSERESVRSRKNVMSAQKAKEVRKQVPEELEKQVIFWAKAWTANGSSFDVLLDLWRTKLAQNLFGGNYELELGFIQGYKDAISEASDKLRIEGGVVLRPKFEEILETAEAKIIENFMKNGVGLQESATVQTIPNQGQSL